MLFERSRSSGSIIEICRHGFFSLRISLLLRSLSCRRSWRSIPLFTDVHLSSTVRGLDYCHQYSIRRQKECKHLLISCLCLKHSEKIKKVKTRKTTALPCAIPISFRLQDHKHHRLQKNNEETFFKLFLPTMVVIAFSRRKHKLAF